MQLVIQRASSHVLKFVVASTYAPEFLLVYEKKQIEEEASKRKFPFWLVLLGKNKLSMRHAHKHRNFITLSNSVAVAK